jgi:hypothetical protein
MDDEEFYRRLGRDNRSDHLDFALTSEDIGIDISFTWMFYVSTKPYYDDYDYPNGIVRFRFVDDEDMETFVTMNVSPDPEIVSVERTGGGTPQQFPKEEMSEVRRGIIKNRTAFMELSNGKPRSRKDTDILLDRLREKNFTVLYWPGRFYQVKILGASVTGLPVPIAVAVNDYEDVYGVPKCVDFAIEYEGADDTGFYPGRMTVSDDPKILETDRDRPVLLSEEEVDRIKQFVIQNKEGLGKLAREYEQDDPKAFRLEDFLREMKKA